MKPFYLLILLISLCSCKGRMFRVPSTSMADTIKPGEVFTVVPADKFEKNEIVVFEIFTDDYNSPSEEDPTKFNKSWQKWTHRLVAVSGDTVELKEGELFVNSRRMAPPPLGKRNYEIISMQPIDELEEKDPADSYFERREGSTKYMVNLTEGEAEKFRQFAIVTSIKKIHGVYNASDTFIIRPCDFCRWTADDFGPVSVPSPGETVVVNKSNYKLYQHVPDIEMGNNTIKEKLYFVLGDNRHAAADSRYNGFIPHSKMYGVVKLKR